MKDYLNALEQSLRKKSALLEQILEKSREQAELLKDEALTPEDFEKNTEEKGALIEELTQCDRGFDEVYGRIRDRIGTEKDKYREELRVIQDLIRDVTAKSTSIQAEEARNREAAGRKFATIKRQIREANSSQQAVNRYYQNMMRMNYVDPQFLDDKH